MTPLRQRMLDAMTVRGLSARTQECYVEAVARLARHYHRSPDLLCPAEVEAYMLHLVKDRQLSYSSVNHAASASRFLFETVLGRKTDEHLRPPGAIPGAAVRAGAGLAHCPCPCPCLIHVIMDSSTQRRRWGWFVYAGLMVHSKVRSAFQRPHCGGTAYARGRVLGNLHLQKAPLLGP
jgi:Phage integrase, N-terminal SAM-like domain